MVIPPLRDFARLPTTTESVTSTYWQRVYFNVLPDVYIPLTLMKAIGGLIW